MRLFRGHISAAREALQLITKYWELTWEMARRDITDRYIGQAFGLLWAIAHPLFLMALYVFIFAFVFKAKVGGTIQMPLDYTTYILAGLIPCMAFQESLNKSCSAITSNASLVKQVVFPLEVLPVKGIIASLLPQCVSTVILFCYVLISHGGFFITYLLLPALYIMQVLAMLGFGYLLAAIGAYFRDIKDFVQLFCVAGMYLMPVFYLPDMIPSLFKPLLYFNPFSYMTWCYQDVIYFGRIEHPIAWIIFPFLSISIFALGYRFFRKLKIGFGNML